jgi:hypothetical protein
VIRPGWIAAALAFCLLATANAGGYRYGPSDHAFYEPAIAERADPSLFPRDKALLAAQSRLWLGDDLIGGLARVSGIDLPVLFIAIYVLTLLALFTSGVAFMRALGASTAATLTFIALLTLRHRIAKTGANTLEGYMHPRILVFALGLAAFACLLHRRRALAFALIAAGAALHTTTALWFGLAAGLAVVADAAADRGRVWTWIAAAGALGLAAAVWAFTSGPLEGRLVVMDETWLQVLDSKDYLFPTAWPAYAWIANLAYPVLIMAVYRARKARAMAAPGEQALIIGLTGLLAAFAVAVPLTALRVALAVQMQVNRIFWVLDAVALAYLAWWIIDLWSRRAAVRQAIVIMAVAIAVARGVFVLFIEARRPLIELRPRGEWVDTLRWIGDQPERWHVLADPAHAWTHGLSVRVGAHRDTVLELGKDSALAMYDRAMAMRVAERHAALADFARLRAADFRSLAARYEVDVLAIAAEAPLDLPVLHRQGRFTVYDLRPR